MKKTAITMGLVIGAFLLLGMVNSYAQDRGGYSEWPVNWQKNDDFRHGPGMMGRGNYQHSQPYSDEYMEDYMDDMVANGHMTQEEADAMLEYMRTHHDYRFMEGGMPVGHHDGWGAGE